VDFLKITRGNLRGKIMPLDKQKITIGRELTNDISLQELKISRYHAVLVAQNGQTLLQDRKSSNGTYVNGQRLTSSYILKDGDRITIGGIDLIFCQASREEPAPADVIPKFAPINAAIAYHLTHEDTQEILLQAKQHDYPALRKAHQNLRALYQVNRLIHLAANTDEMCEHLLDSILQVITAERGYILLMDPASRQLIPKASRNIRAKFDADGSRNRELPISKTIAWRVIDTCESVITSNAMDDARFQAGNSVCDYQICSAMCVPISTKNQTMGIIHVDTPGYSIYNEDDLRLLTAIGNEVAIAIENFRLSEADFHKERLAAVGEAVAGLAHHVKNILGGIKGGSSLIKLGIESNELKYVKTGWEMLDRNLDKISDTVLNMLNYSKERKPEYQPTDLNKLLLELIELCQPKAQENQILITPDLDATIPTIMADPHQIQRALMNIFTNSLEAIDEEVGGEITVKTRFVEEDQMVKISLSDTGSGIDPQIAPRLFEIFTSTKGSRGTGLGLAVTGKIIKEHQGQISVYSPAGSGATFIIELPVSLPLYPLANTPVSTIKLQ
jgi:signal transduction histidine kinase